MQQWKKKMSFFSLLFQQWITLVHFVWQQQTSFSWNRLGLTFITPRYQVVNIMLTILLSISEVSAKLISSICTEKIEVKRSRQLTFLHSTPLHCHLNIRRMFHKWISWYANQIIFVFSAVIFCVTKLVLEGKMNLGLGRSLCPSLWPRQ